MKSYEPGAVPAGITTAKLPELPVNDASTIEVKPDKAFVPAETEYMLGEFATAVYGMLKLEAPVNKFATVPKVIEGLALTSLVTV